MPLFAFIGHDGPRGRELRKLHRPAHLEHWSSLVGSGRVRFGGPLLDERGEPRGSVLLFEAESAAAAREQAEADPYLTRGIFERYELFATRQVLPEPTD